jgi:hypothetical protein
VPLIGLGARAAVLGVLRRPALADEVAVVRSVLVQHLADVGEARVVLLDQIFQPLPPRVGGRVLGIAVPLDPGVLSGTLPLNSRAGIGQPVLTALFSAVNERDTVHDRRIGNRLVHRGGPTGWEIEYKQRLSSGSAIVNMAAAPFLVISLKSSHASSGPWS